jgi:hypothetical protein
MLSARGIGESDVDETNLAKDESNFIIKDFGLRLPAEIKKLLAAIAD